VFKKRGRSLSKFTQTEHMSKIKTYPKLVGSENHTEWLRNVLGELAEEDLLVTLSRNYLKKTPKLKRKMRKELGYADNAEDDDDSDDESYQPSASSSSSSNDSDSESSSSSKCLLINLMKLMMCAFII
jgi:hypothetical protein